MGCERYNYGHGELLSWVEGNDVFLKARVYEKVVTEQDSSSSEEGETAGNAAVTVEERAVDLTAFDDVEVDLVKVSLGTRTDIETAIDQTEDNCLVVHCPYTLESGEYALEIRLIKDGIRARSFDVQFTVVQTDCEAQTTFEVIDGCRSASLRVTLQVVSQALVRGKSAYELWKELPGNEDKGLQDFIDEVIDLNRLAARAAADHTTAESDHSTAASDHATATEDHAQAVADHNTATSDHGTAESDHQQATNDHATAANDHETATDDHRQAASDHITAGSDHGTAETDHSTAEQDHVTAVADHSTAGDDHSTAVADHEMISGLISTDIEADGESDDKAASPKAVKTFIEGKGYLTEHQDISGKADKKSVYTKDDTYTKAEVNNLVTTPYQGYVTVEQYGDLPTTGSTGTIYRVSNWNGSSVVTTSYCEYAWNGSGYVLLSVKGQQGTEMRLLTEETATIAPNVLNKWSVPVEELVLTLSAGASGCENEYKLEFTVDGDNFTLSLGGAPVRWAQEPEWTDGITYQVSILNNLAIYAEWEAEVV